MQWSASASLQAVQADSFAAVPTGRSASRTTDIGRVIQRVITRLPEPLSSSRPVPIEHSYSRAARIASASASWRRASSAVTRADNSGSARTWRISSRITSAAATSRACEYPRRNP